MLNLLDRGLASQARNKDFRGTVVGVIFLPILLAGYSIVEEFPTSMRVQKPTQASDVV